MKTCSLLNVIIKVVICVIHHDWPKEIYTFYWMYIERLTQTFKKKNNTEMSRNYGSKWKEISNSTKKSLNWKGELHKSSITFWAKLVLQPKNNQKSEDAKQPMDINDLEITSIQCSILVYLNCFYYQANLKLIDFLKFC